MSTATKLREILHVSVDDSQSAEIRVLRMQAIAAFALAAETKEPVMLTDEEYRLSACAWESAHRASYGSYVDQSIHAGSFVEGARGRPRSVESAAARAGYGAGEAHAARHGGPRGPDVESVMGATMAIDSAEMPAEAMSGSAVVAL